MQTGTGAFISIDPETGTIQEIRIMANTDEEAETVKEVLTGIDSKTTPKHGHKLGTWLKNVLV